MKTNFKVASSHKENGVEICNTCYRPTDQPFRYTNSEGEIRGCIASCHDKHIRRNTKPDWMTPRYVLPRWVTEARNKIHNFERCAL